jgi:RNA polymerase sigma-70 factor (ECF subfamily)
VDTDDDATAIRRCGTGDMRGLDALMARHQVSALRLAYLLTGDRAHAEDVVQDSFLQAFRSMRRFRPERPFAPWLQAIVTHVARQRTRSIARRHEISSSALLRFEEHAARPQHADARAASGAAADPAQQAESAERRSALLQALGTLTHKQREAVVLRYYMGCNDRELAHILGCSSGTARQRIHAGLAALERVIRARYAWLLAETPSSTAARGEAYHA